MRNRDNVSNQADEIESEEFISIDASTTRDIDDAFLMKKDGDDYVLSIALARPDAHWTFGSPLDRVIAHRATSLYLPEGTAHMMPEKLGTGLYSLLAGEKRPVFIAEFRLDSDGKLLSSTPREAWITVKANITYEAADAAIESGE